MIPCSRPFDVAATIPMTLLYLVFGQFKDDWEALTPTRDNNILALTLQEILVNFYEKKDAIREVLSDAGIILTPTFVEGTQSATNGNARSPDGAYRFNLAIFRNELESCCTKPSSYASSCYLESTRNHAGWTPRSVLACIILLVFDLSSPKSLQLAQALLRYRASWY